MESIDISKVPRESFQSVCYLCKKNKAKKEGAKVKCAREKCRSTMHVSCAQGVNGLREVLSKRGIQYSVYCEKHVADHPEKHLSLMNISNNVSSRLTLHHRSSPCEISTVSLPSPPLRAACPLAHSSGLEAGAGDTYYVFENNDDIAAEVRR